MRKPVLFRKSYFETSLVPGKIAPQQPRRKHCMQATSSRFHLYTRHGVALLSLGAVDFGCARYHRRKLKFPSQTIHTARRTHSHSKHYLLPRELLSNLSRPDKCPIVETVLLTPLRVAAGLLKRIEHVEVRYVVALCHRELLHRLSNTLSTLAPPAPWVHERVLD